MSTEPVLTAQHYWTADQLKVMRGLDLPVWYRPVLDENRQSDPPISQALVAAPDVNPKAVLESALAVVITPPDIQVDWLVVTATGLSDNAQKLWANMLAAVGKRVDDAYILQLAGVRGGGDISGGIECEEGKEGKEDNDATPTDPFSDVVQTALTSVQGHIHALRPKLIVAMGTLAAQALLSVEDDLPSFLGELHEYEQLPLLVMQHPETLLKNPALKAQVWRDLNLV